VVDPVADVEAEDDGGPRDGVDGPRCRLSGAIARRLPGCGGAAPTIPGVYRSGGSGAPATRFVIDLVGIQKDPCVIFVSNLDLLVRTGF
jgi:hypothetical protein